jgi:hypothetical protein
MPPKDQKGSNFIELYKKPAIDPWENGSILRPESSSGLRGRIVGLEPTQGDKAASIQQLLPGRTALPFVISTGAYPDFLLRAAGRPRLRFSLKKTA